MISTEVIDRIIGADALDAQDDRIGEVGQVYVDEQTDRPTWVSVRLGLLSGAEVLVPLQDAQWDDHVLHVAVDRDVARDAPRKDADEPLTVGEEERLYTHYGMPTVRHPREAVELITDPPADVCYSVSDVPAIGRARSEELTRAS